MHAVWLALLLILSLYPSTSAHAQTLRAERPTLTVGEKWIRSDGAYELVRIEGGAYVFAAGSGRELHLNRDLHIVRTRRGADIVEWDAVPRIDWPLAVGKSGLARGSFRSPTTPSGGVPVTHSYKVESVETLTIAGRSLDTFKIAFTFFNERNQRRTEYYLWDAPTRS